MKSRKRPRSWHRSFTSGRVFMRLLRTLPTTDATPDEWGEGEQLHRKTNKPKKRRAS